MTASATPAGDHHRTATRDLRALLGLTLACVPSPPPPETEECDTPDAEATIDGVALEGRFERGSQGTLMMIADVEWLGEAAPTCAAAEVRLVDDGGTLIATQSAALETERMDGGRRSTSGVVFMLADESLCAANIEIDSYGHSDSVRVVNPGGWDCSPDAGASAAEDAGSLDDAG